MPKPVGASRRIADCASRLPNGGEELLCRLHLSLRGGGKGGPEPQSAQALPRPAQVEEFGDALEALREEAVVGGPEDHGLGESRVGLDEDELATFAGAAQRGVGRDLDEVAGIVRPQLLLAGGKRPGDGLDLAQHRLSADADLLVDPSRERDDPAPARHLALHGHLELRVGALGEDLGAKLVVPVRAELRPPDPARSGADTEPIGPMEKSERSPTLIRALRWSRSNFTGR